MIVRKFFRLQNPEPGAAGGGEPDRGDDFTPTDEEDGTAALAAQTTADAAAAALDKELTEKTVAKKITKREAAQEDPDAETDEDPDADPKDKKANARIPLSRHEAVLAKEREKRTNLERELAQYKDGDTVKTLNTAITEQENEVIKLEKDYATQLTDGHIDDATKTMAEIRRLERDMAEAKSDLKIQAAESRAVERTRYSTALERIEASFPTLNPDHDNFDEAVMDEVVELKDAYQLKGLTPTAALQKAVNLIVGTKTTRQEIAVSTEPRVANKDVGAERKTAAALKAAAAAAATPPNTARVGLDSDKVGGGPLDAKAVIKLPQKEFAALNDETLSRLRGDTL